ncbi:hypothetical protein F4808DRAFT_472233 [Astrocystis sublimbata]|nr:hypothetical protein F4808DRAFT_472233 [Astrocystis sublimbata]
MPDNHSSRRSHQSKLRNVMPKSGMIYRDKIRLTHRRRRDEQIANALLDSGYTLCSSDLCRAFTPMFQLATPICIKGRAEGKDLWDMLPLVQRKLDWACTLGESVFLELFTQLIEARTRWEQKPTTPYFDYDKYYDVVLELIKFRKAVGDCPLEDSLVPQDNTSWILTDAGVYNELAGGLYKDEVPSLGQDEEHNESILPLQNMTFEKPREEEQEEEDPDAMQLDREEKEEEEGDHDAMQLDS